jgi:hypothetical protein
MSERGGDGVTAELVVMTTLEMVDRATDGGCDVSTGLVIVCAVGAGGAAGVVVVIQVAATTPTADAAWQHAGVAEQPARKSCT